jgi:D-glycero-D-manno-heptose 1,7-bisphosphate phosphatase
MGVCRLTEPRPAVFFDRDGTLNRAFQRNGVSVPPSSVDELEILPGVREALDDLRAAGLVIVVMTNQPDVARGTVSKQSVEAINAALCASLPIDALMCCFHDDVDDCACRKPRPGMLLEAAGDLGIDLSASFAVGDRWRDSEAGRRAGCKTIQIRGAIEGPGHQDPDFWAADVADAAQMVLRLTNAR